MSDERNGFSRKIRANTIANYFFRGIVLLISLLYSRYVLGYLGNGVYGMWITATTITSWMNALDFGIGNGLRNELAKAYAENDVSKQNSLIARAFVNLCKVSSLLFVIATVIAEILIAVGWLEAELRFPMHINNLFFCINLVLGLANSIAYSFQKSWIVSLFSLLSQATKLLSVFALIALTFSPNLVVFSLVNGGTLTVCYIILILTLWKCLKFSIIPPKNSVSTFWKDSVVSSGLKFFILQICGVVLYYTDNLIIKNILGNEAVTKYSFITTVYDTGNNIFSILLVSLWSAVTYAAAKADYKWIRREEKRMVWFWGGYSVGVVVVSIMLNWIIRIWLKDNAVHYELPLVLLFGIYTIITGFEYIFISITNGLGRLKIQMVTNIIAAVINIPLSILLGKTMGLGLFGVKLATLICMIPGIIIIPIDVICYVRKEDMVIGQNSNNYD